jgi:hypothetical protein
MWRVLLGMVLALAWRWAARHVWARWRAYGDLPPELVRRSNRGG